MVEGFGGGLKLAGLTGDGGKITPPILQDALSGYGGHSPHQMIPSALSITQASEAGTIYRSDEIAALAEIAHARSLAVHMDGARFANALVRLNATPADLTWRSGIDVLSFGATKGGALAAEAVVIFDPARAAFFGERRKRAGHLLSKHRFIAAQFLAYLESDCWLTLARQAAGASYYVRSSESLDVGSDNVLIRLVTSFTTEDEDIERFVGLCKIRV